MLSSNPKYQKYKQYFRKWINDQYAKKEEIQKRGKREDDFAPVKNKDGVDSPKTAKELYEKYWNKMKK